MERFEDSPDLFGCGCGSSTNGEEVCEWCGKVWNKGLNGDEPDEGVSIRYTTFGGKNICECCFGKIESAIWARRLDVAIWLKRRTMLEIEESKKLLMSMQ
jgi:hypothetical protein